MDKTFEYFMDKKADTELTVNEEEFIEEAADTKYDEPEDSDYDDDFMEAFDNKLPPHITKEKLEEANRNWEIGVGDEADRGESRVVFPPDDELVTVIIFPREMKSEDGQPQDRLVGVINQCGPGGSLPSMSNFNVEHSITQSMKSLAMTPPPAETIGENSCKIVENKYAGSLPVFDQSDLLASNVETNSQADPQSNSSSEDEQYLIDFEPKQIHKMFADQEQQNILNHNYTQDTKHATSLSYANIGQHPIMNHLSMPISHGLVNPCYPPADMKRIIPESPSTGHIIQRTKSLENLASENENLLVTMSRENNSNVLEPPASTTATPLERQKSLERQRSQEYVDDWIAFEEYSSAENGSSKTLQLQGEALPMQIKPPSQLRMNSNIKVMSSNPSENGSTGCLLRDSSSTDVLAADYEMRRVIRGVFNSKTLGILQKLPKSPKLITLAKDQVAKRSIHPQTLQSIFAPNFIHFLIESNSFVVESKWPTCAKNPMVYSNLLSASTSTISLEKLNKRENEQFKSGNKTLSKETNGKQKVNKKKKVKQSSTESEDQNTSLSSSSKSPTEGNDSTLLEMHNTNTFLTKCGEKKKKESIPLKKKEKRMHENEKDSFHSVFHYISKNSPRAPKGTTNEAVDRLLRASAKLDMEKIKIKSLPPKKSPMDTLVSYYGVKSRRPITASVTIEPDKWMTKAIEKTYKAEANLLKKIKADKNPRVMDAFRVYKPGRPASTTGTGIASTKTQSRPGTPKS